MPRFNLHDLDDEMVQYNLCAAARTHARSKGYQWRDRLPSKLKRNCAFLRAGTIPKHLERNAARQQTRGRLHRLIAGAEAVLRRAKADSKQ